MRYALLARIRQACGPERLPNWAGAAHGCGSLTALGATMSEGIVKLVFLRVDGDSGPRKAVVPLVEGSDFEQFLARVRRRLGVPDNVQPVLNE